MWGHSRVHLRAAAAPRFVDLAGVNGAEWRHASAQRSVADAIAAVVNLEDTTRQVQCLFRKVHLAEERAIARITVQTTKQGFTHHLGEVMVPLLVSLLQPLECSISITPVCIR